MVEHSLKWYLALVGQDEVHQPENEPDKTHQLGLTCSQRRLKHRAPHSHSQNPLLCTMAG